MSFSPDGWLEGCERMPGPATKLYAGTNTLEGAIYHSAEGYESTLLDLAVNGPYSWHFSNMKNGRLVQHYSVFARCAHVGPVGTPANRFIAVESEGIGDHPSLAWEPLTVPQIANLVLITREMMAFTHRNELLRLPDWRLPFEDNEFVVGEHGECKAAFNSWSTGCPSRRIPWDAILAQLPPPPTPPEEDELSEAEKELAADRFAALALMQELSFERGGKYRPVIVADEGDTWTVQLWTPDRQQPPNPIGISVRKEV
jgi:hypothetical protein